MLAVSRLRRRCSAILMSGLAAAALVGLPGVAHADYLGSPHIFNARPPGAQLDPSCWVGALSGFTSGGTLTIDSSACPTYAPAPDPDGTLSNGITAMLAFAVPAGSTDTVASFFDPTNDVIAGSFFDDTDGAGDRTGGWTWGPGTASYRIDIVSYVVTPEYLASAGTSGATT